MSRIKIAKDKADLVKALVAPSHTTGAFETYADAIAFAASLGAKRQKRVPLGAISTKEPAPIALEIFTSRGYDLAIQLIAIAETQDPKILSIYDRAAEEERAQIFEEYANGGLEILRDELRGAVDYTERILLMLISERFKQEARQDSFDLSRFL